MCRGCCSQCWCKKCCKGTGRSKCSSSAGPGLGKWLRSCCRGQGLLHCCAEPCCTYKQELDHGHVMEEQLGGNVKKGCAVPMHACHRRERNPQNVQNTKQRQVAGGHGWRWKFEARAHDEILYIDSGCKVRVFTPSRSLALAGLRGSSHECEPLRKGQPYRLRLRLRLRL